MIGHHTLRDLDRARTIITVLIRNGFGQILSEMSLPLPLVIKKRITVRGKRLSFPERLRRVCEELGPTFVKFGQILSVRADILPPSYIAELGKLQDEVPPFPFDEVKKIVEQELGGPLDDIFAGFDPVPVAAASMAQVHYAVLADGSKLAVKVQRPGIRSVMQADIEILRYLASLIEERVPRSRAFNPTGLVDEFSRTVNRELDFIGEAQNLIQFGKILAEDKDTCCPGVFLDLTTPRVLTMERLEGKKFSEIDFDTIDRKKLAHVALRSMIKQVLQDGFFHADPHPGNIFILRDGRLAFLDLGAVGRLTRSARYRLLDLIIALERKDYDEVTRLVLEMGEAAEPVDEEELKRDVMDIIDRYYGLSLKKVNASEGIQRLFELAIGYGIRLPRSYALVGKVLITCENIGRALDPDIDLIEEARPYIEEIALRRWMPDEVIGNIFADVRHAARLLKSFPGRASAIMAKVERGRLAIEFKHVGIEKLVRALDRVSSRITAGLIIAALIIGSSYIISLQRGPFLLGHPLLGIIGFVLAAAFAFIILISILRSGGI